MKTFGKVFLVPPVKKGQGNSFWQSFYFILLYHQYLYTEQYSIFNLRLSLSAGVVVHKEELLPCIS